MRLRRRLPIIVVVLLIAAAVALIVFLRKNAPPEPARLLPGADGFVYVNLQWMRRANLTGQLPEVPHEAEYQDFIKETGFQFERDLEEAAFAIHYPPGRPGTTQGNEEPRFSEVFVGKFQGERLTAYLGKLAAGVENYQSVSIYNIPLEGRTLRVAIVGVDSVAASNHPDPQVIRGMIDRSRKLASPFGGPALLRKYYRHVPLASVAWGIFRVEPGAASSPPAFGISFLFSQPGAIVASVRYLGSVHFKAVAFTASEESAKLLSEKAGTFLSIFHSAETTVGAQQNDPDMRQFLESLKVEQHGERAELSAVMPVGLLRKIVAESPAQLAPEKPAQPPPAASAPAITRKRSKPANPRPLER